VLLERQDDSTVKSATSKIVSLTNEIIVVLPEVSGQLPKLIVYFKINRLLSHSGNMNGAIREYRG